MKHPILTAMMAMLLNLLLFMGGAHAENLLSGGKYLKETVPHRQTDFRNIWVENDEEGLRVSGKLYLKSMRAFNLPRYVEVSLVDKDGSIIETRKVEYYPRALTGGGRGQESKFSTLFGKTPPEGTTIRLSNVN